MTSPLVSAIVVVKNGEKYIAEAIQSILDQSYRPLELIIVDGNSRDRTQEIAGSFAEARIITQKGSGIADAYNTGIRASRGEFTAFLSSDDFWTPDKLEVQIGHMLVHPQLLYTVGRVRFILESDECPPPGFRPELLNGEYTALIMETLVARRSVWDKVGLFDTRLQLAEDVDWFSRARHLDVPMEVLARTLLYKRIHGNNASFDIALNNRELLKTVKRSIERQKGANALGRVTGQRGEQRLHAPIEEIF
ncbi:MAG: glycosyltransferase [Caldilineales bacterium]|nr:glycosyltransferase [Caldilineales bacterium]